MKAKNYLIGLVLAFAASLVLATCNHQAYAAQPARIGGPITCVKKGSTSYCNVNQLNLGSGITAAVTTPGQLDINASGGGGAATSIEASGGLTLTIGAITDGQYLRRSGTSVLGATLATIATSGSASDLASGTVAYARLPTGTSASTVMPGDTAIIGALLDEGSAVTHRTTVNFTGAGVSCTDNSGSSRTDCTVSGGYQTVGVDGSSQTSEGRLNLVSGSGITFTGADNSGTNSTDVTAALSNFYAATVNTTDGTQTTCTSVPISSNTVGQVECRLTVIRTSDNAAGGTYCRRAGYINTAGTVSRIDGAVTACGTADGETAAISAFDVTLDVSTTNVRARVTGAAATNATWGCKCYLY